MTNGQGSDVWNTQLIYVIYHIFKGQIATFVKLKDQTEIVINPLLYWNYDHN